MSDLYNILYDAGLTVKRKGKNLFINCIFHHDTDPSLSIFDNGFKCFGCGKSGSLDYLFQKLGIIEKPEIDVIQFEETRLLTAISNKLGEITGLPTDAVPFLKNFRNILPETFKHFNIVTSETYPDQLLFPLYGTENQVCGFIRKPMDGKYLYNYYTGYVPYNFHAIFPSNLMIVEGVFDALSVWQAGYKNVMAISGTGNIYKVSNLLKRIRASNVKLMFDGDEAGYRAAEKLNELYPRSSIITLPNGTDPNDLSNLEEYIR
jgi:DNA primase